MLVVRAGKVALVALLGVSMSTACAGSSPDDTGQRAASVYVEVVRWFADRSSDDPEPLPVFVEPRGEGASLPLDVQADVVNETQDIAEVRFIDARDEALTDGEDGHTVVVDDGVLIRLAPVVEEGDRVLLDVDVHEVDDDFVTMQFDIRRGGGDNGDEWRISESPVTVPPG